MLNPLSTKVRWFSTAKIYYFLFERFKKSVYFSLLQSFVEKKLLRAFWRKETFSLKHFFPPNCSYK